MSEKRLNLRPVPFAPTGRRYPKPAVTIAFPGLAMTFNAVSMEVLGLADKRFCTLLHDPDNAVLGFIFHKERSTPSDYQMPDPSLRRSKLQQRSFSCGSLGKKMPWLLKVLTQCGKFRRFDLVQENGFWCAKIIAPKQQNLPGLRRIGESKPYAEKPNSAVGLAQLSDTDRQALIDEVVKRMT